MNGQSDIANKLSLRPITADDSEAAAELSAHLGYPVSVESIKRRIQDLSSRQNQIVYVACMADKVVAWIDVSITQHLTGEPYGDIGGLIVSEAYRNFGIGQKLLEVAERWVVDQGFNKVLVRSNITREGAHRFYLREGYSRTKTSAVFSKDLKG